MYELDYEKLSLEFVAVGGSHPPRVPYQKSTFQGVGIELVDFSVDQPGKSEIVETILAQMDIEAAKGAVFIVGDLTDAISFPTGKASIALAEAIKTLTLPTEDERRLVLHDLHANSIDELRLAEAMTYPIILDQRPADERPLHQRLNQAPRGPGRGGRKRR